MQTQRNFARFESLQRQTYVIAEAVVDEFYCTNTNRSPKTYLMALPFLTDRQVNILFHPNKGNLEERISDDSSFQPRFNKLPNHFETKTGGPHQVMMLHFFF